ncbi:efflux RND transporter periplasmic adaptor subunit [Ferruginibacter lapsinanis]|uniref:efflux RND transporter periplasmic adaptor subunit n=1 Tax=Ferruginibacter lapsinanis TaxID=563172 RepID=UPI001E487500|nr:efflux RND transporter periplasmic adaptor subunit [Ferruginibacter lapsinanis]UEG51236.1 efflux RND transporter periplasmic adaptor subunit [Ferruginibacter lapsinanis]
MVSVYKKILFASICIFALSCKSKKEEATKQNTTQQATLVDVIIAGTQQLSNTIEANGNVVANESLEIHPEVSGRLTYLNVPDGASVSAGTILAKINDADLQAQLSKSKSQLSLAEKTEERLRKLLAVNGINQADYDAALNSVNNIKADIQLLKAQIDKTVVKAPFAGVLGLRMVSPGAYITPQTILATLQETNKVKIDFTVPAIYADLIKRGATVSIINNNEPKRTAVIVATETEINTTTRNLKVRALLGGVPINPGAFVKVLIDAGKQINSIVIPTNAIIPDATSKKLIVVKNGKGTFVNVETGLRTSSGVEITKGIAVGDSVVVTGVLFVKPNAPVKIKSVKNLTELTKEQ